MLRLWLSLSPLLFGKLCWPLKEGGGGRIEKGVWGRGEGEYCNLKSKLLRASKELGAKVKVFGWVTNGISVWLEQEPEPQMGQRTRKSNVPWNYLVQCQLSQALSSQPELRARRGSATRPRPPVSRSLLQPVSLTFGPTALRGAYYFIQVPKQPCKVVSIKSVYANDLIVIN